MALHWDETFQVAPRSMSFGLYLCGGPGRLAMASLGPWSNLSRETRVASASEAGFVASSDLCIAPEVCYQMPGLTTVKPAGVPLCDAATTSSVCPHCSRCPWTKTMLLFLERYKSLPSRLFSPGGIKENTTRRRGFDANTCSLSFSHCESRWCKAELAMAFL